MFRLLRTTSLAACLLLATLGIAHADDTFDEQLREATASMDAAHYDSARIQLDAAYRIKQDPQILRLVAITETHLGHTSAAIAAYERFLTATPGGDPEVKLDVYAELTRLRSVLAPPAVMPQLRLNGVPLEPGAELLVRRYKIGGSKGMISSGLVLLTTAHMAAMFGGGEKIVDGRDEGWRTGGGLMMIPVLGPFISPWLGAAGDNDWRISWALMNGTAQITGLVLIIMGAKHKDRHPVLESIKVAPIASATMQGLGVSGKF